MKIRPFSECESVELDSVNESNFNEMYLVAIPEPFFFRFNTFAKKEKNKLLIPKVVFDSFKEHLGHDALCAPLK